LLHHSACTAQGFGFSHLVIFFFLWLGWVFSYTLVVFCWIVLCSAPVIANIHTKEFIYFIFCLSFLSRVGMCYIMTQEA
jgi:hypothetical protein